MKMTDEQKQLYEGLTKLQQSVALVRLRNPLMKNGDVYREATGKLHITDNNARVQGFIILNRPSVKEFLETFEVEALEETIMGREEMMLRLSHIARSESTDVIEVMHDDVKYMDMDTGYIYEGSETFKIRRDADMSLVSELANGKDGIKIKTHSSTDAMKQLAQLQGFNAPTKTEISGPNGGPVETKQLTDEEFAERLTLLGLDDV